MTPVAENSLRKAAVFVRGLAPDAAAAMLGRLSAEEARALRVAIAELEQAGDGKPATSASMPASQDGSVELQLSTSPYNPGPQNKPQPTTEPEPLDGAAWFRQLRDADPQSIADYLSREQPRAIALVLGYLPPDLSAGVLQCLPVEEQPRVVAQLADQHEADPDSLRVIATGLADWVRRHHEEDQRRSTRVATIRQIVAATPEDKRRGLLATLAASEPHLAAALADLTPQQPPKPTPAVAKPTPAPQPQPTLTIDDLRRVDGRALAEAVGSLDARMALLALAAAPDEVVSNLTAGLPRIAARELRQRMHRVGPTTLVEIDRAQSALALAVEQVVSQRRTQRSLTAPGGMIDG
ncbi:FliG C-terminal domain-containing protein [Botrimarina mediterranea]|uniref:Flagellar motor switch protein FliG n=1 Tax=Botrimarina mediterranea TaxID=2528022 RepID=A0A518KBR8_9BACT|nr:FliG C-terminal domain-containing protein [Botrimarina mediterranea]QDV75247.1 Flagellar motor switch protein FliG [Botrimarina mediterranea]QDV79916.1 Flagellar motor switch protein FliG [Planctomycetes bacterium K2D]